VATFSAVLKTGATFFELFVVGPKKFLERLLKLLVFFVLDSQI